MHEVATSRRDAMRALAPYPTFTHIPANGAAHIVRDGRCEPQIKAGSFAIIDFEHRSDADFLLVKQFGKNPEIVTRQMQIDHPRSRVLGYVVGQYAPEGIEA